MLTNDVALLLPCRIVADAWKLKEDAAEFATEFQLRDIIKKHSDYVAYPIYVGESEEQIAAPSRTTLYQNTPNPFNPMTQIHFDLAHDSHVSLQIYDVAGRLVRGLANEKMTAGFGKKVVWNGLDDAGRRVSSGVYFYRLEAEVFSATRKLVVMK